MCIPLNDFKVSTLIDLRKAPGIPNHNIKELEFFSCLLSAANLTRPQSDFFPSRPFPSGLQIYQCLQFEKGFKLRAHYSICLKVPGTTVSVKSKQSNPRADGKQALSKGALGVKSV